MPAGLGTFALLAAAGTSVIDRYLLLPAVMVMLFTAVALGGWSMLEPGSLDFSLSVPKSSRHYKRRGQRVVAEWNSR